MRPVAFFDIDGTIFRSSLLIELVEELIRDGVMPPEVRDGYFKERQAWQNREGTYEVYIGALVDAFLEHLRGVPYGAFADTGKRVVARQQKRVYRYTRDLVTKLKAEGYFLVAISQSPKTILDVFCRDYGFDKVYGRIYEIGASDCFTGVVAEEHLIENKAAIVHRVFERHEGELIDTDSVAVGDTDGDIPLLDAVAHPICFNPNQALYTYAKKRGWPIVIERKDVIYEL